MTVAERRLLAADRVDETGEVTGLSPPAAAWALLPGPAAADAPDAGAGAAGADPAAEPQTSQ